MHVLPQADELGLCFGAPCVQPLNKAAIIDIHLISSCVQPRLQFFPQTAARIGWLLFAMSTSSSDTMSFTSPPPPAVFLSRSGSTCRPRSQVGVRGVGPVRPGLVGRSRGRLEQVHQTHRDGTAEAPRVWRWNSLRATNLGAYLSIWSSYR